MNESEGLNNRTQREIERIVAENWPVDGPFILTLDEVTCKVRSQFGMPKDFLNLLAICIGSGISDILKRKDDQELMRLAIRMYLSGLLQGAEWQRQGFARRKR